jgi:hypothetical protein
VLELFVPCCLIQYRVTPLHGKDADFAVRPASPSPKLYLHK